MCHDYVGRVCHKLHQQEFGGAVFHDVRLLVVEKPDNFLSAYLYDYYKVHGNECLYEAMFVVGYVFYPVEDICIAVYAVWQQTEKWIFVLWI
jgi:hypothetical protein